MFKTYLKELITPDHLIRALHSQNTGLLVPRVSKSNIGGGAFSYQDQVLCNQLPVWIQEAVSLFKTRLKTFLFDKAPN